MDLKKAELRQRYLACLQRKEEVSLKASEAVVSFLRQFLASATGPVAAFKALSTEPHLEYLVKSLSLDWVFPRTEGETLSFYRSTWEELQPGAYNVFEPKSEASQQVDVSEISIVLVPGVCFDRQGHRLGRGKAFYDKTLKNFNGIKVGVCFSEAVSETEIPQEEHDLKMDWLVTDRFILRPQAA